MRLYIIIRYIGTVLLFNSIFLFISLLISIYHHENSIVPLLYGTIICILFGIFPMIFVPPASEINVKEGLTIIVSGWFVTTIAGSLPYIMWGGEFTLINAWLESVSGYTTTGSSILTDVETLPKGLLFWRSSTNYIGGVGIILFTLLILPQSANNKLVLFNTEMSELAKNNFQYMAKQTIRVLAVVYAGLTLIEIVLLLFTGMPLFDAINHSFCTIAISTILLTMMKVDLLTSFTGTIATLGNVGPGLGQVSSMGNFSGIPDLGKLVYIFNMMLGRLEIFSILTIFIMKRY